MGDEEDYDEENPESWKIYLWPTDEKETIESNEIKVIKAFENS